MRDLRIGNKCLIGTVEENDAVIGIGVVHPCLELLPGGHGAGRIVGETEINQIHFTLGQCRGKSVFRCTGHIDQLIPAAQSGIVVAGPACHSVGVHINGIDRIAHRHHIVHREDIADVAAVALRPVGDKDLRILQMHAGGPVGIPDGEAQEIIGAVGLLAVAPERILAPHLLRGLMHRLNHGRRQRQRHIPNPQPDQRHGRILGGKGPGTPANFREQVAPGQLLVIDINLCHSRTLL